MNPEFLARLTAQLRANPSIVEEGEDSLLSELIIRYVEGKLNADDTTEVAALIRSDPKAKAIYATIEAADRVTASLAGTPWLEGLRARAKETRKDNSEGTIDTSFATEAKNLGRTIIADAVVMMSTLIGSMTNRAAPVTMGARNKPKSAGEQTISMAIPSERGLHPELRLGLVKKGNSAMVVRFALCARGTLEAVHIRDLRLEWTRTTKTGRETVQVLEFDETLLCQSVVKDLHPDEVWKLLLCSLKT